MTREERKEYARLIDKANELQAKIKEPQTRIAFLALCEEYSDVTDRLDQLNPEVRT